MKRILLVIAFTYWLLNIGLNAFGAIETHEGHSSPGSLSSQVISATDDKFTVSTSYFNGTLASTSWVKNEIFLEINDQNNLIQANNSSSIIFSVPVKITTFYDPANPTISTFTNQTLTVTYNPRPGTSFQGKAVYELNGQPQSGGIALTTMFGSSISAGYKVLVEVGTVYKPGTTDPLTADIFRLGVSVSVNRTYTFSAVNTAFTVTGAMTAAGQAASADQPSSAPTKQLQLDWTTVPGAHEYDVEWATFDAIDPTVTVSDPIANTLSMMDASSTTYNASLDPLALNSLFINNATRVTTQGKGGYLISLPYNNDYLIARVRGVTYDQLGNRITGDWNYQCSHQNPGDASATAYNYWKLVWNEDNLNWQYSAAFAEDGKKKEVISYFDGSLRGRQTVTINNSDNVPVAQENVYDEFGRPAASILPAPFIDNGVSAGTTPSLHYVQNFNLNTTGTAGTQYTIANIAAGSTTGLGAHADIDASLTDCEIIPAPLNISSGASAYYSSNNPFLTATGSTAHQFNKYIPNAWQYPLSVTEYTPDNTGRIKVQGGVGPSFQPGSGHTTRYYYGKPYQWELDQLFGNDVGYAEHYLKNMVIDPNGQASISYINASGKTIATALTGPPAKNLDPLLNTGSQNRQTAQVLNPAQFKFDATALTLTATTTYLAPIADHQATLTYSLTDIVQNYKPSGGSSFQLCTTCYYKVTVTVTDDCGNTIYTNVTNQTLIPASIPTGTVSGTCPAPIQVSNTINPLDINNPGEYNISVTLAMDNTVINAAVNNFLTNALADNYLLKQYDYIKKYYIDKINTSGCFSDCTTCQTMLGGKDDFLAMVAHEFAGVDLTDPFISSDYNSWASGLYNSLEAACTELRKTCNFFPCQDAKQSMLGDVSPGGQYAKFDANGNALETDVNVLSKNFGTVFGTPPSVAGIALTVATDNNAADFITITPEVDPSSLSSGATTPVLPPSKKIWVYDTQNFTLALMLKYWNRDWANLFLTYHPEYCKLQFCQQNAGYENWDLMVQAQVNDITTLKTVPAAGVALSEILNPPGNFPNNVSSLLQDPTNNTLYNENTPSALLNLDPFFAPGGPGAAYNGQMADDLQNYTSKVLALTDPGLYPNKSLSKYVEYLINCAPAEKPGMSPSIWAAADGSAGGCNPTIDCRPLDREWTTYRDLYFQLKQKYYDKLRTDPVNGTCATSACQIGESNKVQIPGIDPPSVDAFYVQVFNPGDANFPADASAGSSALVVKYNGGVLTTDEQIDVAYSTATAGSGITTVTIPANQDHVTVNLNGITNVLSATPTTAGVATINGLVRGKIYVKVIDAYVKTTLLTVINGHENYDTSKPLVIGNFPQLTNNTTVTLVDYQGNPTTSNCDVTVTLLYRLPEPTYSCKTNGEPYYISQNQTLTIPAGTSSKVYSYFSHEPTESSCWHNLEYDQLTFFMEASQISGADGLYPASTPIPTNAFIDSQFTNYQGIWNYDVSFDPPGADESNLQWQYNQQNEVILLYPYPSLSITPPSTVCSSNSGPCIDYATKTSRFPDVAPNQSEAQQYTTDQLTTISNAVATQLTSAVNTSCNANADKWIAALTPGITNDVYPNDQATAQSKIAQLRAALIAVCSGEQKFSPVLGVSVLATPGTVNAEGTPPVSASANGSSYTSFGDAILQITTLPHFTPTVNPWIITNLPYPYNEQPQQYAQTVSSINYSMGRMIIAEENAHMASIGQTGRYLPGATADQAFYTYLLGKYTAGNMNGITAAQLSLLTSPVDCHYDDIKNNSNLGSTTISIDMDVPLPPFFNAGSAGCVVPADFTAAQTDLMNAFGNTLSPDNANYPVIFTNFMNQRWGLSLAWADYQKQISDNSKPLCNTPLYPAQQTDNLACIRGLIAQAVSDGTTAYNAYITAAENAYRNDYIASCSAAQTYATLTSKQPIYHYTLYYYDQADNLVRTVPPEGVHPLDPMADAAEITQIDAARDADAAAGDLGLGTVYANYTAQAQSLATALASTTGGTVEMWLNNSQSPAYQVSENTASADNKYIFQVQVTGATLNVDIYPIPNTSDGTVHIGNTTGHYQADISTLLPLGANTHLVIEGQAGTALGDGTATPTVYLNNIPLAVTTGGGQSMETSASDVNTYPSDIRSLDQMRLYTTPLPAADIQNNYNDPTEGTAIPLSDMTAWYKYDRFLPVSLGAISQVVQQSAGSGQYPAHTLQTSYVYNSTNQVTQQYSPDGGTNRYWYDLLSRLTFSQNDRQQPNNQYSYTKYDAIGRITEVGQATNSNTAGPVIAASGDSYMTSDAILAFTGTATNQQITNTWYDDVLPHADANFNSIVDNNGYITNVSALTGYATPYINGLQTRLSQNNLRKRVVATAYRFNQNDPAEQVTYYDYDIDGNVKNLWQQIANLGGSGTPGLKQLSYEYDLVSGKVNFVRYQDGNPDQFYYQYRYDADNRLTEAWSGTQALVDVNEGSNLLPGNKKRDAKYFYYLHGPLARVELGDRLQEVQGVDYAYTLQGWLKGVNSTTPISTYDMNGDGYALNGTTTPPNRALPVQDAYGYALHYYGSNDYSPIGGSNPFAEAGGTTGFKALYNGNIAASGVNIGFPAATGPMLPQLYIYGYDQLNRLTRQDAFTGLNSNSWNNASTNGSYKETASYDGNGNILSYFRNREAGSDQAMDNLTYHYNRDAGGNLTNNQLSSIADGVTTNNYALDLKTQQANNYTYDPIGNMKSDVQSGISNIDWTVYGKIYSITNTDATKSVTYTYDPGGKRATKTNADVTTFYVRDAQGNPLAIYDNAGGTINWKEQDLYGSSRLGTWTPGTDAGSWLSSGNKQYELTNHLGNVLATVSDRRVQVADLNSSTTLQSLTADVITAQDYYPFGMLQPGRQYISETSGAGPFRYGFNGKENDNEVKGAGNQQDYGMRIYDPRLGRFLSVDPVSIKYPMLTPYQFASDSPITGIDQDGAEFNWYFTTAYKERGIAKLKVTGVNKMSSPITLNTEIGPMQGPDIHVNIEKLGFQLNFVEYNGDWVTMPKGYKVNNLPPLNSPEWDKTTSYSDIQGTFEAAVTAVSFVDVEALKNAFSKVESKAFKLTRLRRSAVEKAWRQERKLVRLTGRGTVDWTEKEIQELKSTGKVSGYEGHHINSVNGNEGLAGDPNNIKFVKGRDGHLAEHDGDFRNSTSGELIDRKKLIEETKQRPKE